VLTHDAVYAFGRADSGELGIGEAGEDEEGEEGERYVPEPMEIVALRGVGVCMLAAGTVHSLAATADGRAFGLGFGTDETLSASA
jgi:alpha-tubulin suppressor-like RCC1 family protein